MAHSQDQKREIIQEGVNSLLSKSSIPLRVHLQVIKALKGKLDDYGEELKESASVRDQALSRSDDHLKTLARLSRDVGVCIASMEKEIARISKIEHLKGDPGKDAAPPDFSKVIRALIPYIPDPVAGPEGLPGKNGESPELDIEETAREVATYIKEKQLLDVSDIRNSQSFLFNKKRYKFEELMRGAGGSSTTGGQSVATQYLLTSVQSGLNVTIDLTQLSNWATFDSIIAVYRNNIPQTLGVDFTVLGSTVTINGADASEVFNITYAYS